MDDWAHELAGFENHPDAIKHALGCLPVDKPPTVLQFRAIARLAPVPELPKLESPPADPKRVAAAVEQITKAKPALKSMTPAQECAGGLRRRMADGVMLTESQRHLLAACEGMGQTA